MRERRRQATHPARSKPELVATKPNVCWSWGITKLPGPAKWSYFYLYVVLDIDSRYVVGWTLADAESQYLAEQLLATSIAKQGLNPATLTIHSDNGASMGSKVVAQLLADLGVTKTHSRPHVSNDNPYSEAQFKTLKYRPTFPDRFGSIEDARTFCRRFFDWYHTEHYHSGVAWHHPVDVHYGRAQLVQAARTDVLAAAYERHPERFVRQHPATACPARGRVELEIFRNPRLPVSTGASVHHRAALPNLGKRIKGGPLPIRTSSQ